MKYIRDFHEGENIRDIYLCKNVQSAVTKNGKEYLRLTIADRTGSVDGMIWDPSDGGIEDFEKCEKWCERSRIHCPSVLSSYTCQLKLYFSQGRRAEFFNCIDELKASPIVIDKETLELIRVFT